MRERSVPPKEDNASRGTGSERAQDRERSRGDPPASIGPFLKRPCTERVDAPRPARRPAEAYPPRYGEDGQRSRSGCSGPRMPGSEGMDLWRPGGQGPRDSALVAVHPTAAPAGGGGRALRNVAVLGTVPSS